MKLLLLLLALLALAVACALGQASPSPASGLATKEDIEKLLNVRLPLFVPCVWWRILTVVMLPAQMTIPDSDWNKQVGLDPSPAVLLGSGPADNYNTSPASSLRPFVFLLFGSSSSFFF